MINFIRYFNTLYLKHEFCEITSYKNYIFDSMKKGLPLKDIYSKKSVIALYCQQIYIVCALKHEWSK